MMPDLKSWFLQSEGLRISGQVLLVLEQMNDFMIQGLSQEETVVLTNLLRKIEAKFKPHWMKASLRHTFCAMPYPPEVSQMKKTCF